MHVHRDQSAQATPNGQPVFFAEFLASAGVFERRVESCPLSYTSPNAPSKRDVLGTLLLVILAGHRRYAHITALRGDTVAAKALGMDNVISEDAMRCASPGGLHSTLGDVSPMMFEQRWTAAQQQDRQSA